MGGTAIVDVGRVAHALVLKPAIRTGQPGHVFTMETPDDPIQWTYDGPRIAHAEANYNIAAVLAYQPD